MRLCRYLLALFVLLTSLQIHAGTISFSHSLTGSTLRVTAQGDSSAFYPQVLQLRSDGRWEALAVSSGAAPTANLAPGASVDLTWPPDENNAPIAQLQTVMVRFFDQAGVRFGQIAFFHPPTPASQPLQAGYQKGELVIDPPVAFDRPEAIRTSWVLWPQENGIDPLRFPLRLDSPQPPALHIEWRAGMAPVRVETGAGEPNALLVHETAQGLTLQSVPGGGLQGRQQRAAWLNASPVFYRLALLTLVLALCSILLKYLSATLNGKAA